MHPFLPALSVLAAFGLGGLGIGSAPAAGPTRPPEAGGRPPEAGSPARIAASDAGRPADSLESYRREKRRGLEISYGRMAAVLDSLGLDSLSVRRGMREQYRRTLREVRTVKDNTLVHLEELRVSEQGVTPEIWEEIRARTELSLDSLRRLILSADSTHKLHSLRPEPERNRPSG